jgi:hypothetical protein
MFRRALARYRLECLQRTQANCEAQADPLKYHLNVGKILMRYYDISGMAQEVCPSRPRSQLNLIIFPEEGALT